MTGDRQHPAAAAVAAKGWLGAHKWLLLRRASQALIIALFLAGPLAGIWIVTGNLTSSLTLGLLPLTDPYVQLQSLAAGHVPGLDAAIGAAIVLVAYALVGGRVYCAWVCPVNPVTDGAQALRRRLGLGKGWQPRRATRLWMLAMTLVVAALTGTIAWELVNPVSLLHRGLIFGIGAGWMIILAVFLLDAFVARHGWCGHLCPVGAFYGLLGTRSLLRVKAARRQDCDDCMDCFAICPEPQVIAPALKGAGRGVGPVILARDCTNCGRCIDVCSKDVFRFALRFDNAAEGPSATQEIERHRAAA